MATESSANDLKTIIQSIRSSPGLLNDPTFSALRVLLEDAQAGNFIIPPLPNKQTNEEDGDDDLPPLEEVDIAEFSKTKTAGPSKQQQQQQQSPQQTASQAKISTADALPKKEDVVGDAMSRATLCQKAIKDGKAGAVTEENRERAQELKSKGVRAQNSGDLTGALKLFVEAVEANPNSALVWAKLAGCLEVLGKKDDAVAACNTAIEISPDASAAAFKIRGKVFADMFKQHKTDELRKKALADFEKAQNLDNDEEVAEQMKFLSPKSTDNAKKPEPPVEEVKPKNPQAKPATSKNPDWMTAELMERVATDPSMRGMFNNEKIVRAVNEIALDPKAFAKYQNDPEVVKAFGSFMEILGHTKQSKK
eukprot:ANDGO_03813.mRNA.1 FAM10 family protein At4g22670